LGFAYTPPSPRRRSAKAASAREPQVMEIMVKVFRNKEERKVPDAPEASEEK